MRLSKHVFAEMLLDYKQAEQPIDELVVVVAVAHASIAICFVLAFWLLLLHLLTSLLYWLIVLIGFWICLFVAGVGGAVADFDVVVWFRA